MASWGGVETVIGIELRRLQHSRMADPASRVILATVGVVATVRTKQS